MRNAPVVGNCAAPSTITSTWSGVISSSTRASRPVAKAKRSSETVPLRSSTGPISRCTISIPGVSANWPCNWW